MKIMKDMSKDAKVLLCVLLHLSEMVEEGVLPLFILGDSYFPDDDRRMAIKDLGGFEPTEKEFNDILNLYLSSLELTKNQAAVIYSICGKFPEA